MSDAHPDESEELFDLTWLQSTTYHPPKSCTELEVSGPTISPYCAGSRVPYIKPSQGIVSTLTARTCAQSCSL